MSRALTCVALAVIAYCSCGDTGPANVLDLSDLAGTWRSKFSAHEVASAVRGDAQVDAVQLPFDLSKAPHYNWVRYVLEEPIDVRPYRYLCVSILGDASGAKLQPMLIRQVPRSGSAPNGESIAGAPLRPIVVDFEGWRRLSVPLSAFRDLAKVADTVHQVNFSLARVSKTGPAGQVSIAQLRFAAEPEGTLVNETVPYPPADIAIADEREFFSLLDLDRPGLEQVAKAVAARDWDAAKAAWAEHLATRTSPRWTWSRAERPQIEDIYERKFGGLRRYVAAADSTMRREFNWLGVAKTLDHDIEWLQGPVEWTHVLSRHAYWKAMGYAYWATGDPKYVEDWVYMLKDWIADNPVPRLLTNSRGKNGTVWRTLETGIRGDCWFDVMELFMDAPEFDAEAKYLITRSLVEHARHLHRYETTFRLGNWQVVECTGLAAIGIMLPEFREAAGWRERALDMLVEHMQRDVYPDGAHHELTPGYHGWVMERFLKVSLLLQANGYEVPGLLDRHEKMFEFLMHVAMPDRRFVPIGDAGHGGSIVANMGLGALL